MELSKNEAAILVAFEKGYRVDDNGNVFRKGKPVKLMLKNFSNPPVYLGFNVRLKINGSSSVRRVLTHRLQSFQKFGHDIFKEGIETRHKNGNSLDNSFDNILIGTASENQMDIPEQVRKASGTKASSKIRRFSDDVVREIKSDRESGLKYKDLCLKYKTSKGTLSYLFNDSNYAKSVS